MIESSRTSFTVTVVYASAQHQWQLTAELSQAESSVQKALVVSGMAGLFPWLQWSALKLGVYGRAVSLSDRLVPGDRLEIYDALQVDPKQARLLRVAAKQRRQLALQAKSRAS